MMICVFAGGCHLPLLSNGSRWTGGAGTDRLRIHSNFELSGHDSLVDELIEQQHRLAAATGLSFSAAKLPIDVYLFEDAESFDDFTSRSNVAFASRRAFFVKSDSMLNVYAQWGDRVAEDLRHEVTHGYLHSVAPSLPLWIDEGLAEYFEVGPGTGGLNWAHIEFLNNALTEDQWSPSLGRMEAMHDPTKFSQVHYAEAWLWTHFLLSSDSTAALVRSQMQRYQNKTGVPWTAKVHHLVHDPNQRLLEHLQSFSSSPRGIHTPAVGGNSTNGHAK